MSSGMQVERAVIPDAAPQRSQNHLLKLSYPQVLSEGHPSAGSLCQYRLEDLQHLFEPCPVQSAQVHTQVVHMTQLDLWQEGHLFAMAAETRPQ